jgi:hypothetical protein
MPERAQGSQYGRAAAKVAADGGKAIDEYFRRCLQMTPQQYLMEPARLTARLSAAQHRALALNFFPQSPIAAVKPEPAKAAPPQAVAAPPRLPQSRFAKSYRLIPEERRPFVAAIASGLLAVAIGAAMHIHPLAPAAPPVRSTITSSWPDCRRLTPEVDGCVYAMHRDVAWSTIAGFLGQDEAELRANNRRLTGDFAPKGAQIAVWRRRGQLIEEPQQ